MRLALQKYNLDAQYEIKKGPLMYIADALSQAYMKTTQGAWTEFCTIWSLERVDHE